MPTYEYVCADCGLELEVVQSIHAEPITTCSTCGGKLRKVFGNVGVVFKGSGFYKTDSRAAERKAATKRADSKEAASKTKSGSKDSGQSGSNSSGSNDKASDKASGSAGSTKSGGESRTTAKPGSTD